MLEIKERKKGITWISANNDKGERIGWIGLLDFSSANDRESIARDIVKLYNKGKEQ